MSTWTICDSSTEYAFKTTHLSQLRRTWQSLAVGQCTFSADAVDFDSDPLWAHLTPLTIKKDGENWFQGKLLQVGHVGDASREALDYILVDAWWDVLDVTFLQQRLVFDSQGNSSYTDVSEYLYGQDPYGNKLNNGEVITEALNCVLKDRAYAGLPVPFQIGIIDPDVDIPWRQEHDKKCLQVINEVLGYSPNVCGYLDHSASPPMLHIRTVTNLSSRTLTIPTAAQRHAVRLVKRDDLAVEAVIISYKRVVTVGAIQVSQYEVQKYPTGASVYGYKRVWQTIDLAAGSGGGYNSVEIEMVTTALNQDDISWWKSKLPQFNEDYNKRIEISDLQDVSWDYLDAGPSKYYNELTGGSVPESSGLHSAKQVFRCTVRCKLYNDDTTHDETTLIFDGRIHLATNELTVVDGGSGCGSNFYESGTPESVTLAEPTPVGLPQAFYNATHTPGWEGEIDIIERECSTDFAGCKINVAGGRGEWESMGAIPQTVELDADNGVTRLTVGLPNHLSIQDLVELQRKSRNRTTIYTFERVTGKSASSASQISATPINNFGGIAPNLLYQIVLQTEF